MKRFEEAAEAVDAATSTTRTTSTRRLLAFGSRDYGSVLKTSRWYLHELTWAHDDNLSVMDVTSSSGRSASTSDCCV